MPAVTADTLTLPRLPEAAPEEAERPVQRVTTAPSGFEGEGFPVRRAFAGVPVEELDPFIHLDQMGSVDYGPGEPRGTNWHPHRGFETVTYMLDGTFQHQDSHGGGGVIADGVVRPWEREQRVRPTRLRLPRHRDARGARHDHLAGKRGPPGGEHLVTLLGGEVWSPSGVRPHRHARDLLAGHPRGVGLLRICGEGVAPERNRDGRDQPPLEPGGEVLARSGGQWRNPRRAFSDSMAARCCGASSSKSSFATLFSGILSGCPVPNTNRSTPMVWSNVARWSSGGPHIQQMSHQMRAASSGVDPKCTSSTNARSACVTTRRTSAWHRSRNSGDV